MQNSTNDPKSGLTTAKYKGQKYRKYETHFRKKQVFNKSLRPNYFGI